MVEVPAELLEQRRSAGVDRWDEMWEGVLHMVPPPSGRHQRFGMELALVLAPLAKARGLVPSYETGLFGTDDDYRVPDQVYADPERATDRGVDGAAELVVEILSPGDETYEKLDWYARLSVAEILVVDPDSRAVELFASRAGRAVLVQPGADVTLRLTSLGADMRTTDGPRLRITWETGSAEI
jgi:Uma2 family endonuclease